jgi:hypothetical protein
MESIDENSESELIKGIGLSDEVDLPLKDTNTSIDKLTLEIMGNKGRYKKYLSKADPKKYQETQEYLAKIKKYGNEMNSILNNYIYTSNKQVTNDLDEAFEHFSKSCIKYLEMKQIENIVEKSSYKNNEDDEDVLFPYLDNNKSQPGTSSYWGESITKLNLNNTLTKFGKYRKS